MKVTNREELTKYLATMFRNQNANMFANEIMQAQSRARLHKDEDLTNKIGTLEDIYSRDLWSDPTVAFGALKDSLENLAAVTSSPAMGTISTGLAGLAIGIDWIAGKLEAHPALAVGTGLTVGAAGLAGAGWLSYKVLNGFGLGTSAKALDGAAVELTRAAFALKEAGVVGGKGGVPAGAGVAGAEAEAAAAEAAREAARTRALGRVGMLGIAGEVLGVQSAVDATDEVSNPYARFGGPQNKHERDLQIELDAGGLRALTAGLGEVIYQLNPAHWGTGSDTALEAANRIEDPVIRARAEQIEQRQIARQRAAHEKLMHDKDAQNADYDQYELARNERARELRRLYKAGIHPDPRGEGHGWGPFGDPNYHILDGDHSNIRAPTIELPPSSASSGLDLSHIFQEFFGIKSAYGAEERPPVPTTVTVDPIKVDPIRVVVDVHADQGVTATARATDGVSASSQGARVSSNVGITKSPSWGHQ